MGCLRGLNRDANWRIILMMAKTKKLTENLGLPSQNLDPDEIKEAVEEYGGINSIREQLCKLFDGESLHIESATEEDLAEAVVAVEVKREDERDLKRSLREIRGMETGQKIERFAENLYDLLTDEGSNIKDSIVLEGIFAEHGREHGYHPITYIANDPRSIRRSPEQKAFYAGLDPVKAGEVIGRLAHRGCIRVEWNRGNNSCVVHPGEHFDDLLFGDQQDEDF